MPVYEYVCGKCSHRFEVFVRSGGKAVACPECSSKKVDKVYSVFGLNLGASPEAPQFTKCT
jgi:putative FmdB family regulatory protein